MLPFQIQYKPTSSAGLSIQPVILLQYGPFVKQAKRIKRISDHTLSHMYDAFRLNRLDGGVQHFLRGEAVGA